MILVLLEPSYKFKLKFIQNIRDRIFQSSNLSINRSLDYPQLVNSF